jgi:hypothetical protein
LDSQKRKGMELFLKYIEKWSDNLVV